MTLATRTSVLSAILAALALLPPLSQPRAADAAPLPYTTVVFDVLVEVPEQWNLAKGTPGQAYVNGQACGSGFVDAKGPYVFNVIFSVPDTCAYPGAAVEFVVGGYNLKDRGGWGIGYTQVIDGFAYKPMVTSLQLGPAGRWAGTLYGLPAGATIEARIGGTLCASAQSYAIPHRGRVPMSGFDLRVMPAAPAPYGIPHCGFDGARVEFFVNGVSTGQVTIWTTGLHSFNLFP